jgi:glucosamine-6-phosphate deaminase
VIPDVFDSEAALAAVLARRVSDLIVQRPDVVLGFPTGQTPLAFYAALVALAREELIDWSHVRTFNLDEFVGLGDGAPGSYRSFMQERLFRHVNIKPSHVGFPDGRAADLDQECQRYEDAIAAAGGLDLLILGIGANGHIGFNEPAAGLASRTHRAVLAEASRAGNALWFGGEIGRVPREALSMGMATILHAREIVLMATGGTKADAIRGMVEGAVTTKLPASFLQLHPRVTVMLDGAAAAALTRR